MSNPCKDKSSAQLFHFYTNMQKRFGITMNKERRQYLLNLITSCLTQGDTIDCRLIQKQSNRVYKFYITYEHKDMILVYDMSRDTLVTCLYPDFADVVVEQNA
jgi:hypothetical protein